MWICVQIERSSNDTPLVMRMRRPSPRDTWKREWFHGWSLKWNVSLIAWDNGSRWKIILHTLALKSQKWCTFHVLSIVCTKVQSGSWRTMCARQLAQILLSGIVVSYQIECPRWQRGQCVCGWRIPVILMDRNLSNDDWRNIRMSSWYL